MNTLNDLSTMISNVDTIQKKTVSLETNTPFSFGIDTDSNYGYIKNGEENINKFETIDDITTLSSGTEGGTAGSTATFLTMTKDARVKFTANNRMGGQTLTITFKNNGTSIYSASVAYGASVSFMQDLSSGDTITVTMSAGKWSDSFVTYSAAYF